MSRTINTTRVARCDDEFLRYGLPSAQRGSFDALFRRVPRSAKANGMGPKQILVAGHMQFCGRVRSKKRLQPPWIGIVVQSEDGKMRQLIVH